MFGRRKRKKAALARSTSDLRDQAREVAGHSGEALKEFADLTGVAAKEFASRTRVAAKDLVGSVEKAAKRADPEPKRKRGRALKVTLALGAGLALLGNERVRGAIRSLMDRGGSQGDYPEIWRPDSSSTSPGDGKRTAAGIAEESS